MPPPPAPLAKPVNPRKFVKPDGTIFTLASVEGLLGLGLTGIVLRHGRNALKIPKVQVTSDLDEEERDLMYYINETNVDQLENEKHIYKRLGDNIGVVPCLNLSADGIELAFIKNGTLEKYLKAHQQGPVSLKARWLRSLVDTLCYIHGRGVIVHDVALRNILVDEEMSLKFVDFGQSTLIPSITDCSDLAPEDSTQFSLLSSNILQDIRRDLHIDIFYLAFAMYSVITWEKHDYNLYAPNVLPPQSDSNLDGLTPSWPDLMELPCLDGTICEDVIRKCWTREYRCMREVQRDLHAAVAQL